MNGSMQKATVHVQNMEHLSRGRVKVKIKETGINLSGMTHEGKDYVVFSSLGRGRYIMKETVRADGLVRLER
jgi:hypothetical protein